MSDTRFTTSEQIALKVSMQHFGRCDCSTPGVWPRRRCEGHSFLMEEDRRVNRPMRLVYVRRTRQQWIDGEWLHMPPPHQGEPVTQPVLPDLGAPEPSKVALPEDDAPDALPW
jgi:hypothetical protein